MKKKNLKRKAGLGVSMAAALLQPSALLGQKVFAKELEYEGITQILSTDYYLEQTLAVELEVEEVYVEEGSQVQEGDDLLKFTDESWQDALDYYEAAVLRAEGELTNTQMEYDQGILEAEYTYELAKQKASQAEFVKEYQQQELEDTIEEHEEILEEIDARISEVESQIADGSYDSDASSQGSAGGSAAGAGNGGETGNQESETETASELMTEALQSPERQSEPETESMETAQTESGGQTETEKTAQTDENTLLENETDPENTSLEIQQIKQEIQEKEELYETLLGQLEAAAAGGSQEESEEETDGNETKTSELLQLLNESMQGDTNIKTNLENMQKNLDTIPDAVLEVVKEFYPDYEEYVELLEQCIVQLTANLSAQESVFQALQEMELNVGSADTEEIQRLLGELRQTKEEYRQLYDRLIALEEQNIQELEGMQAERNPETQGQDGILAETEIQDSSGTGEDTGVNGEEQSGEALPGAQTQPEEGESEERQEEPQTENRESGMELENMENSAMQGDRGSFSGGNTAGGSMGSSLAGDGNAFTGGGAAGTAGGAASGTALEGSEDGNMEMLLSEEDISLFGDTYDLTQVRSLLEQEPSDSDQAKELLDELEASKETVAQQYDELVRNQKATELGIQYTYDSSVIAGKLAEITYQQEINEWEETLESAETSKEELEQERDYLESFLEGTVTADRSGTIAAVSCEAGDGITGVNALVSYYDTDTVQVVLEVSQYEISQISVGDTVQAEIAGAGTAAGIVSEKSMEAESGTSRTSVNYLVTVSFENENGRLSSGSSAAVTLESQEEERETAGEEKE